jgi:hypothetical protein
MVSLLFIIKSSQSPPIKAQSSENPSRDERVNLRKTFHPHNFASMPQILFSDGNPHPIFNIGPAYSQEQSIKRLRYTSLPHIGMVEMMMFGYVGNCCFNKNAHLVFIRYFSPLRVVRDETHWFLYDWTIFVLDPWKSWHEVPITTSQFNEDHWPLKVWT